MVVARREGEELVIAGLDGKDAEGISYTGMLTPEDYRETVLRCIEEIKSGEAFQIVVSQRFEAEERKSVY